MVRKLQGAERVLLTVCLRCYSLYYLAIMHRCALLYTKNMTHSEPSSMLFLGLL